MASVIEVEEMKEAFDFLELEEVDSEEFHSLYQAFADSENDPEKIVEISPDSKLAARSWMMAYAHLDARNAELKDYQKQLEKRYIDPVKEEMAQNERAQAIIKLGIKQFLDNSEEDKIKFPDVGTFSSYSPPDKIVYPEDEESMAQKIFEAGTEEEKALVRVKYQFDKNAVKAKYKADNKLPIKGLSIEANERSVRFQKAKPKASKQDL